MNTTKKKVELITLTPDEGMWLMKDTGQGTTFSKKVTLGAGDDASSWREITDARKEELERLAEEEMRRELKAHEEEVMNGLAGNNDESLAS